jgi:hypothetical protein
MICSLGCGKSAGKETLYCDLHEVMSPRFGTIEEYAIEDKLLSSSKNLISNWSRERGGVCVLEVESR